MITARVSVIIPAYNAAPWIADTLASVFAQGMAHLETIVVDDGSTDGTAEIIERDFPTVHLLRQNQAGPSRARNAGTAVSSGQFIQYLDADDLLAPGKLQRQLTVLRESGAEVAYGDWQRLYTAADGSRRLGETVARQLSDPEIEILTGFWCPTAAYLFRRSVVDRVGGWHDQLPIIQDARFALDCALRGATFVRCAGLMAYYRVHSRVSVSRRDPIQFGRDCLRNTQEVEALWLEFGNLSHAREKALISAYTYVARSSFRRDPVTFDVACAALERLQPGFVPEAPRHLALMSRCVGYRHAEAVAWWYRAAKNIFRRAA